MQILPWQVVRVAKRVTTSDTGLSPQKASRDIPSSDPRRNERVSGPGTRAPGQPAPPSPETHDRRGRVGHIGEPALILYFVLTLRTLMTRDLVGVVGTSGARTTRQVSRIASLAALTVGRNAMARVEKSNTLPPNPRCACVSRRITWKLMPLWSMRGARPSMT